VAGGDVAAKAGGDGVAMCETYRLDDAEFRKGGEVICIDLVEV